MRNKLKGFTLVELIVVIAIIGILAGILIPNLMSYIKKAKIAAAMEETRIVVTATQNALSDSVATNKGLFIDKKTFVNSSGTKVHCGAVTNWMLASAQSGKKQTDKSKQLDYMIASSIISSLDSEGKSSYKFYNFNGAIQNPIGLSCKDFYSKYKCPGIILVYSTDGELLLLEYYNKGILIHYEDGNYTYDENQTKFVGYDRITY